MDLLLDSRGATAADPACGLIPLAISKKDHAIRLSAGELRQVKKERKKK